MRTIESLRIIALGGTFDKVYDPEKGALGFDKTHVPEILREAGITLPIEVEVPFLMDSLDMEDRHRTQVVERCESAGEKAIVVVNGTDRLTETAQTLDTAQKQEQRKGLQDKTIVVTGAMIPYAYGKGDATFNLAFAIATALASPPGVYVAMNARVFSPDNVRKNRELRIFEPKDVCG